MGNRLAEQAYEELRESLGISEIERLKKTSARAIGPRNNSVGQKYEDTSSEVVKGWLKGLEGEETLEMLRGCKFPVPEVGSRVTGHGRVFVMACQFGDTSTGNELRVCP